MKMTKRKNKKIERLLKLITEGKLDNALQISNVKDIEDLFSIGILFGQKGNYHVVEKIFERVIQLNPNYAEAWYNKGIALGNLGKYDEEVKCYDEAIKINPDYTEAWYNKGIALGNLGKYDEEVKCYDEAIKINPNLAEAWSNKGIALGNLGKYDEAVKCYDEAIKINPNYAKAWSNKGIALGNLGKYDEEVKCYDEAIKINPNLAEAWSNKGIALGNLGKYDEEVKCYDEAIKINPNLAEAWYNKGIALGNLGKYDEEVKCYDEAIKINPNVAEAWSNKGIALGNLGKYDEEVKCYDEAIKINPNDAEAWYNKGIALGNLGKYDEAVKCYDKAIKINPNYAKAYGNKGITFLNTRKYDEAKVELRKAGELFSIKGAKKDADKAYKVGLLAKNASELMNSLEPLDKQFLISLESQTLVELKEKSLNISKDIQAVIKKFKRKNLPDDAVCLLISKEICFTAMSNALKFEVMDLKKLRDTEEIFEEWGLRTLAMSVGSLVIFIRGVSTYKSLEEIPKEVEDYLLQLLKAAYVLDGTLTKEITKGKPFAAKPTAKEKKLEIKYVSIEDTKKDLVKVCLVQLDFSVTTNFPYKLVDEEKDKVRGKVFEALEIAKKENVNIIIFPELSFAEEWTKGIKNNYKDMMIICGTFYDDNDRNICKIIIDGKDYFYAKCNYSIMEEPNGKGLKCGDKLFVFQTKYGVISVLTCVDFDENWRDVKDFLSRMNKQLNFVINPRWDIDSEHNFQAKSSLDVDLPNGSRSPTFMLHINAKRTEWANRVGGGGTTIIASEHTYRIEKYKRDGLKPKDSIKYKICEAKDEMILIASLNISQTMQRRTEMGNWYRYDGKCWKKLEDRSIWV